MKGMSLSSHHAKNQKARPATDGYSKVEMYLVIELRQQSGLSNDKTQLPNGLKCFSPMESN